MHRAESRDPASTPWASNLAPNRATCIGSSCAPMASRAAPLRGTAGAPATGLRVEDARPARARRTSATYRWINHAHPSGLPGAAREPSSSPRNCPARGHRVNAACGAASRSATPSIDPATTPKDSAPARKRDRSGGQGGYQLFRADSTQNSLPSGSARTTPRRCSLPNIRPTRPGPEEPLHFGLLIIRPEVQMKPVLGFLSFRHRHEDQPR